METLLWVLVPLLILTLLYFWLQSVRKKNATQMAAAMTPERAREAASGLNAQQHQEVYRMLARGELIQAAQAYHNATKSGYKEALYAVQAMAKFPQEFRPQTGVAAESSPAESAPRASALETTETPDNLEDLGIIIPSDLSGLENLPSNPNDPERRSNGETGTDSETPNSDDDSKR